MVRSCCVVGQELVGEVGVVQKSKEAAQRLGFVDKERASDRLHQGRVPDQERLIEGPARRGQIFDIETALAREATRTREHAVQNQQAVRRGQVFALEWVLGRKAVRKWYEVVQSEQAVRHARVVAQEKLTEEEWVDL